VDTGVVVAIVAVVISFAALVFTFLEYNRGGRHERLLKAQEERLARMEKLEEEGFEQETTAELHAELISPLVQMSGRHYSFRVINTGRASATMLTSGSSMRQRRIVSVVPSGSRFLLKGSTMMSS
jgi:hypothetical protein